MELPWITTNDVSTGMMPSKSGESYRYNTDTETEEFRSHLRGIRDVKICKKAPSGTDGVGLDSCFNLCQ